MIITRGISLVLLALLPACSRPTQPAGLTAQPAAAVPVTVATAWQTNVPIQLHAIGTVEPNATVSIKSRVEGEIAKASFKEGDEVPQGQVIFTIDPSPFKVALQQAEAVLARDSASLQNAELNMRRTDELANTKAVSATTVDQNRAAVATLKGTVAADQAAIEAAKLQLSYCTIQAPIAGRIGLRLVDVGNVIKNNDTVLATINQLKPINVNLSMPEQHLPTIRDRMAEGALPVTATVPRQENRPAQGQLKLINNQVDVATGTILLQAVFPNADELLWPGQFVDVTLTLRVETNAVVVPTEAVQLGQQGRYVILVQPDQTVEFRPVEVGETVPPIVVVKKGLQAGEPVVTSGQIRLIPGSKVEIKNAAASDNNNPSP